MKRALVLTNEAAGHPFRRSLPPPPSAKAGQARAGAFGLALAAVALLSGSLYSFVA